VIMISDESPVFIPIGTPWKLKAGARVPELRTGATPMRW